MGTSNGRGGHLKVLVVDDDPLFCQVMEVILGLKPPVAEVHTATSATTALELCGEFSPDVVIVDHFMPVMDGDKLGARLRRLLPDSRLLSMTGMRDKEKPDWADAHVFKDGELFQALEQMLMGGITST